MSEKRNTETHKEKCANCDGLFNASARDLFLIHARTMADLKKPAIPICPDCQFEIVRTQVTRIELLKGI